MVNTLVNIPGYCISEELYNGSRTLVYRGYREADSLPVVIKLLKNPYPSFSELLSFRNQYTITKNLHSPLIVQTYSLEPYQNGYALVMEDFGGISLNDWRVRGRGQSLQELLKIGSALCNTLDILYRERIIHKDIKPANILINPETKQVKLIDFSIASLLPRETQTLINPNVLEGTLAYISPEQTGRMNRGIDYRTDFYSLGVTLYELLSGELPFNSNDPMELVHSHIAKMPTALENREEIPQVISDIVMKLMAKNAEDRYQSALGLKFDLENCLTQLQGTGEIQSFEIGQRDISDRFIIPDKLYGREGEVSTLLQAFERVSLGATEMMLVAGFSGIGKTAVVNEIHKPIVRQRGYFIKGKYDQFQRNIPFSAFVQAFRDLMGQLLTESDAQIQQWRNQILEAVGENGQVIIEVIPELSKIIGEQLPVPELSGTAAQNRFNLLFKKFTQVFTTAEHPLVIFLDDLQWSDLASVNLMQLLMTDTGHLLLIGAYRDNEVKPGHPLMLTLNDIQKAQVTINRITLAPLSQIKVNQLVADTLKCPESLAWNLSQLLHQKTQGNPFFATQFLKALHQENIIKFDCESGCWQCNIAQVITLAVTDDVVAFMSLQLRKLPPSTQEVLQLAACIGNQFDLETLAIVSEQSQIETAAALWKALQEGLILPISDIYKFYVGEEYQQFTQENYEIVAYRFLHDRVQQAAYSLIPADEKQPVHLKIGQLLLSNTPESNREERIFEIVSQLNVAAELITQSTERQALAQFNLMASCKAKAATAYTAACKYAQVGIGLLSQNSWQHQYDLTLALHQVATETAYLSGDLEQMTANAHLVLNHAKTPLDQISVYEVKIEAFTTQGQFTQASAAALAILKLLGVELPAAPTQEDVAAAFSTVSDAIGERLPCELLNLSQARDANILAAARILTSLAPCAYLSQPLLYLLVILKKVYLSVVYGNESTSTFSYVSYGILMCGVFGNVELGYEFGQLALDLLSNHQDSELKGKTLLLVYLYTSHWKMHLRDALHFLQMAYCSCLDVGDLAFAGYSAYNYGFYSYFAGQNLTQLEAEVARYCEALKHLKQNINLTYSQLIQQILLNLIGDGDNIVLLSGTAYNEQYQLPLHETAGERTALALLWINKLVVSYLFSEFEQAVQQAGQARQYLDAVLASLYVPIFHFYESLAQLAWFEQLPTLEQQQANEYIAANQEKLNYWTTHAPMNFLHKFHLVEAERERVQGNKASAIDLYDRAIIGAKENGYIQEEALANELAAKFYLEWDKERIAGEYMTNAYYGYARWGAKAKVADLERRYPQLLAPILKQTQCLFSTNETIFASSSVTSTSSLSSTSSSVSVALDLGAILKASQTISSEIELEKLLSSLLRITIENAGANKCVLMLVESDKLQIRALAKLGLHNNGNTKVDFSPILTNPQPFEESRDIPIVLINTVKRSLKAAVIIDATVHPQLINDPYIGQQQPKSILCSPILHQGKLLGVLYLENNLTTGAFTHERVELLNLLCTQAAISLENARLYLRSQNYALQLEQSLDELNTTQSRFYNLVDNVPGVVYQFRIAADGTWTMPYISADCYDLYEITAEQAIANVQLIVERVHSEDAARHQQSIAESMQTLDPWRWEGRIVTLSGIIKWIHGEAHIVQQADGSLVWDGVLLDISERKVAELDLQLALLDLQQAQIQIVQSEKMSALGNLVAGVAHEMNNPLGFISASLKLAKPTIADLVEHLGLYQKTLPNKSDEILTHAEEIDLDYSLSDLLKMIDSMSIACDRLKNISTSLRTFSRADQDYKVPFNIHQGIDSTILILKHRLKANEQRPSIEVVTNYGNLPQVECFPGQLNQVFMNLLANAIDALDESNHGRSFEEIKANPNCITITTSVENNLVKIAIFDNGKGMDEQVKSKIFDHLFTTKAVGKGTGLGLAIAKSIIVEKHGGTLAVNSTPGVGTELVITLPILVQAH
ncbi:ATP-binding sensor histidine kinase [Nostoc sp. ATCC 53789]|uniref:trifunctional serine/threonine-protein kinase/ATP-binding protein/sensor histidine kinase n=1 Tax=Nostoc sp. ATCC 53789 TaxID=76335 RepID=UPI000DEC23A9|nr:ATP-binding sensor histidine kinase [Nostoc sp. ATCC 53789]QHG20215.1 AAA family ATPase [Nostoc sp. ATCC 53789]RCJ28694.1 histidine kinase [Nostoc sp. ATCC 53789]